MAKRGGPRIPQGRAPLPVAGQVTRDNPIHPDVGSSTLDTSQTGGALTPSQLDPRTPMENDAAPSRLDFENLKTQVEIQRQIMQRLVQLLPAGAQGELAPLLEPEAFYGSSAQA